MHISISDFASWNKLAKWGVGLYPKPTAHSTEMLNCIKDIKLNNPLKKDQIERIIKFVQEEIRYVGIEEGVHNIKPHNPNEVFLNRYGDCKDKTYLLQTMLSKIGQESHIAWVSTSLLHKLDQYPPSPRLFDHTILYFAFEGNDYWIDATKNHQANELDKICFPDYEKALILDPGSQNLHDIVINYSNEINVEESFIITDAVQPVLFETKTTYTGYQADYFRQSWAQVGQNQFKSNLINYFSTYYPMIEWESEPEIKDDPQQNIFTIKERYLVHDFWQEYGDEISGTDSMTEYYAIAIRSYLVSPDEKIRTAPVALSYPLDVKQRTQIVFPKKVDLEPSRDEISGKSIYFERKIQLKMESIIEYSFHYKTLQDHIPVSDVSDYFKEIEKIKQWTYEILNYGGTSDQMDSSNSGYHTMGLMIFLLALVISVFLAFKLFKFDVRSRIKTGEPRPIGGWLILIGLAMIFSLIRIIFQLFNEDLFDKEIWELFSNPSSLYFSEGLQLLIIAETVYNALILVFMVLLLVLFTKRRSSFPALYIIFVIVNFVFLTADYFVADHYFEMEAQDEAEFTRDIISTIIAAAVWIPYMLLSERVKNTFIRSYSQYPVESTMDERSESASERHKFLDKMRRGNTEI